MLTFANTFRCHEQFDLPYGPDIVTFSKKMLSGGIYHNREHRPPQPGRVQNTWIGDAHKIIMLEQVSLTALEKLDWKLIWEEIFYKVDEYPYAIVNLKVSTLSFLFHY